MNTTKFSVIVPVYNAEEHLCRCLDSIVRQTYTDIEIILIDDGSTDSSGNICNEYAEKDKRILVVHKENNGVAEARNDGIKKANGDYIIFIDNDDYIEHESCEQFNKMLVLYPETEVMECGFKVIDYLKNGTILLRADKKEGGYFTGRDLLKGQLSVNAWDRGPWAHIYQRDFLLHNNLLFIKRPIDDDLYWKTRLLLIAQKCIISNFTYYTWNKYIASQSNPKTPEKKVEYRLEVMKVLEELEPIISQIEDDGLKTLFFDKLIQIYIDCIFNLKLYTRENKHLINRGLLKHKVYRKFTKLKLLVLNTFPELFHIKRRVERFFNKNIVHR